MGENMNIWNKIFKHRRIITISLLASILTLGQLLSKNQPSTKGSMIQHELSKAENIQIRSINKWINEYSSLFPDPNEQHDRIVEQLNLNPRTSIRNISILMWYGIPIVERIEDRFAQCPINNCHLLDNQNDLDKADIVVFLNTAPSHPPKKPFPNQIWALFYLESPYNTDDLRHLNNTFNWTLTYRADSVIVTPYSKFHSFGNFSKDIKPLRNYAEGKTKKVAWFVSSCITPGKRELYVRELQKYISVDIYGFCGPFVCQREADPTKCYNILKRDYKFYLAFENSVCKDYITEKFFNNALQNDIIPVVRGARPEDYERVAPPNSYIHVDDYESPKELAQYLHKLDQDDDLYNQYFRWKQTVAVVNSDFYCRMCLMAQVAPKYPMWYEDLETWWRGENICIEPRDKPWPSWRNESRVDLFPKTVKYGYDRW